MEKYRVTFSCNPNDLSLPAQSTRTVEVNFFAWIPFACARARNFNGPVTDITIISLSRVME